MKIVIDARESGTSTGRYVDKLIEYLHKLQPKAEITVLTKSHRLTELQKLAPNFEILKSDYKEFTFSEQLGLLRQLNQLKPDLVHFSMTQQPAWYKGKTITTIHDLTTARFRDPTKNWLTFKTKQVVYRWLIRRVAHKADHIITPSEFVKHDVAQYAKIDGSKISVTYEAADKISAQPKPINELRDAHFLLYVGRAQPHKNLKRLVKAFQEIKWTHPELKLVLAGKTDANYEDLQQFVETKKIADVIFTDFVEEDNLRWLYENALAYVFPSLSEGFGLPGLEAMQYDLPVISSNATSLPEIYKDAALYFDPLDVRDMAEKIRSMVDDQALAKDLAQKGRKLASHYSWQTMAKQTWEIYQKFLG